MCVYKRLLLVNILLTIIMNILNICLAMGIRYLPKIMYEWIRTKQLSKIFIIMIYKYNCDHHKSNKQKQHPTYIIQLRISIPNTCS